jgi:hypothetical protein
MCPQKMETSRESKQGHNSGKIKIKLTELLCKNLKTFGYGKLKLKQKTK